MARLAASPLIAVLTLASACGTAPQQPASYPAPPSPAAAVSSSQVPSTAPSAPPSPPAAAAFPFVFPVAAKGASYGTSHHDYPATDIFATCGSPVVAVTNGVILEVSRVDTFDLKRPTGATKGGLSFSLLGDDGARYYGSHLLRLQPGISAGVRVRAGQRLGDVGHTGNASGICHLHFGISPGCAQVDDWWIRRGVIWPAKYLDAWRQGKAVSAAPAIAAWHAKHGCPKSP